MFGRWQEIHKDNKAVKEEMDEKKKVEEAGGESRIKMKREGRQNKMRREEQDLETEVESEGDGGTES